MSQPEIYWSLMSQPGRAVKALTQLASIPCTFITVDLMARESRSPSYLSKYPVGKIPFLRDGAFSLGESPAIMIYLCEKYSPSSLDLYYGSTPQKRAVANMFISWYQNYFRPALFKPVRLILGSIFSGSPVNAVLEKSLKAKMMEALSSLETILSNNPNTFLAANNVMIPDLLFFFEVTNLVLLGVRVEDFKHIFKWYSQVGKIKDIADIQEEWRKEGGDLAALFQRHSWDSKL